MTIYPRTGRLLALYSIYNVEDLIQESVRSVSTICDEFWFYDGRYLGFQCPCGNEHDNSCDGTQDKIRQICEELHLKWKYRELSTMWEFDKRQRYFDDMEIGDTGLVIDDDEFFYGSVRELWDFAQKHKHPYEEFPKALESNKAAYMNEFMSLGAGYHNFIRVHVKTPGLKYKSYENKLDYTFVDDEGEYKPSQCYPMKNARLVMLMGSGQDRIPGVRSKPRERAKIKYDDDLAHGRIKP